MIYTETSAGKVTERVVCAALVSLLPVGSLRALELLWGLVVQAGSKGSSDQSIFRAFAFPKLEKPKGVMQWEGGPQEGGGTPYRGACGVPQVSRACSTPHNPGRRQDLPGKRPPMLLSDRKWEGGKPSHSSLLRTDGLPGQRTFSA